MIGILEYFSGENPERIVQRLDETMRERYSQMVSSITLDIDRYNSCENKKVYQLSSYALTLTLSARKIKNLHSEELNILNSNIRNATLHYCLKNIREISYKAYPELTKAGDIHYHGIMFADAYNAQKLIRWWRRHHGFVKWKYIFDLPKWLEYIEKDQEKHPMHPMQVYKTAKPKKVKRTALLSDSDIRSP